MMRRLVIFEKNPINRGVTAAMLTLKTASVLLPCDLEECLAALREHPCDYLLLDNDECDDDEQAALRRALAAQSAPPRLVLFAGDAAPARQRWAEAAPTVLEKPVRPNALLQALAGEAARILVVDDTPENLDYMIHALRKAGLETAVADNGPEALALIDAGAKFDLILLDIRMPEMDGYETLRHLRRRGVSSIVVAVTAAQDTVAARRRFINEGFDDFLAKPTPIHQLLAIAEKYVTMNS